MPWRQIRILPGWFLLQSRLCSACMHDFSFTLLLHAEAPATKHSSVFYLSSVICHSLMLGLSFCMNCSHHNAWRLTFPVILFSSFLRHFLMQPGHAWLSQHYKWALDKAFLEKQHSHVIIVEDDMLFSPDFLHFFAATAVLLEQDPSLWCISTWNDNGLKNFDWDPMRMVHIPPMPFCYTCNSLLQQPCCWSRTLACGASPPGMTTR